MISSSFQAGTNFPDLSNATEIPSSVEEYLSVKVVISGFAAIPSSSCQLYENFALPVAGKISTAR